MRGQIVVAGLVMLLPITGACGNDPAEPFEATHVASVVPAGDATGVAVDAPIVVEFTHPMMAGMEQYVALHRGDVTGPVVPGEWSWSADRTRLTFVPAAALEPQTRYTLHVGGGLRDADGRPLGLNEHCRQLGGQWADRSMMGSGPGSGGMMGGGGMMGSGWQHANGTYGMLFTFVTQ